MSKREYDSSALIETLLPQSFRYIEVQVIVACIFDIHHTRNGDLSVARLARSTFPWLLLDPGGVNDIRVLRKCSELNRFLEAMLKGYFSRGNAYGLSEQILFPFGGALMLTITISRSFGFASNKPLAVWPQASGEPGDGVGFYSCHKLPTQLCYRGRRRRSHCDS
jgi:hypothetical protein